MWASCGYLACDNAGSRLLWQDTLKQPPAPERYKNNANDTKYIIMINRDKIQREKIRVQIQIHNYEK